MLTRRIIFISLFFILAAGTYFAQDADTVYVPALDDGGNTYVNSIIDYVVADTNESGEQLHSVYKLERGNYYVLDEAADFKNPVELVADPAVDGDSSKTPPKIISNITSDGSTATGSLLITWADLTVKNIWLAGIDLAGQNRGWNSGQAIAVQDSFVTVVLDSVWIDYNGWNPFSTSQPHTRWHINNLHVRNEQNPGDVWTAMIFYMEEATVLDTFIVKNTTYFQSNGFFLYPPSVVQYLEVDHCTFANTLKWPFHGTQWLNASFTNNIFYNTGSLSLTVTEQEGQDPDGLEFGLINVDTLSENSLGTSGKYTIPENERTVVVKNNLYYFTSGVQNYWTNNDTVNAQLWMNSRTEAMFADDETWPGLEAENNYNQDPLFSDFTDLSDCDDLLVEACTDFRGGSTHEWDWDSDQDTDPTYYRLLSYLPLGENFKSYTGLTGTDGLPLGDLNYYPDATDVKSENNALTTSFELEQNYPNPFNPTTTIAFKIAESGNVSLTVYNLLGQEVKTLVSGEKTAGSYSIVWNGKNNAGSSVASGIYFYKLSQGGSQVVKKMMLLK